MLYRKLHFFYRVNGSPFAFQKISDQVLVLNVNDVFNGRKRIMETYLPGVLSSRAEMQWRVRQVTLSFTYRFNKAKNEREKQPKRMNDGGGEM